MSLRVVICEYVHTCHLPSMSCGNTQSLLSFPPSLPPSQPCKVKAFEIKENRTTTAFEIKFEDSVIARDKTLDGPK